MSTALAATREIGWRFDNTYARLPEIFHSRATPATFREPRLVILNGRLARELGLDVDELSRDDAAVLFSGQTLPEGSSPIAQAYAGHQFGGFTMLGDGRAILLGEHRTPTGSLVDIQFKGSGRTRYSRGGDGLAALGPMLREYIISEAMSALGIPTTRSLAVVATGDPVYRESVRRGAVLTRVAASHLRVGTFEFAARVGHEAIQQLADYAIARHDFELASDPDRYFQFFQRVAARQASLIARWQLVGFIHGVMNTDNMAISGETIDYGPCAFMNAYHRRRVYSSIDRAGRYAYGNQPAIAQWNLARFAETLLPLFDPDGDKAVARAMEVLEDFPSQFETHWQAGMRRKFGFVSEQPEDAALIQELLDWMEESKADFTNTFRGLANVESPSAGCAPDPTIDAWFGRWRQRLEIDGVEKTQAVMRSVNPAVIPRNHRVEAALEAAEEDDLAPLHELLTVVSNPFDLPESVAAYREPPADEQGYRTFCGT